MKPVSQTIAKPRVVVAEHTGELRVALVRSLAEAGLAVTEAHDGRELLDLLQSATPGFFRLVVTAQLMPKLAGLECLALAGSRAPFVIISPGPDAVFHAAAAKLGAAAVVEKPFDLAALADLVMTLVRRGLDGPSPTRAHDEARATVSLRRNG